MRNLHDELLRACPASRWERTVYHVYGVTEAEDGLLRARVTPDAAWAPGLYGVWTAIADATDLECGGAWRLFRVTPHGLAPLGEEESPAPSWYAWVRDVLGTGRAPHTFYEELLSLTLERCTVPPTILEVLRVRGVPVKKMAEDVVLLGEPVAPDAPYPERERALYAVRAEYVRGDSWRPVGLHFVALRPDGLLRAVGTERLDPQVSGWMRRHAWESAERARLHLQEVLLGGRTRRRKVHGALKGLRETLGPALSGLAQPGDAAHALAILRTVRDWLRAALVEVEETIAFLEAPDAGHD
jgi:hypothetical protein